MIARLFAICAIFIATSIAWMILGGTISTRTHSSDTRLAARVQSVWGSAQNQSGPSGTFDVETNETQTVLENGKSKTVTHKGVRSEALELASSRVRVGLDLEHRRKGLMWYSTYKVDFQGDYGLRNPDEVARGSTLRLTLPGEQAIYDDLTVRVNGQPVQTRVKNGAVSVDTLIGPGAVARFEVGYKSQGIGAWHYLFGEKVSQVRDFQMTMKTNFHDIDFPDNTLAPATKRRAENGWELEWKYANLFSGYQIAMTMPEKLQPGPLAAEISFFAPVSLFFFFFLMFIITTLRQIELHPMNYFFLAAAFFAFHLLLAYMVDHVDIHASFIVASLVSAGLVASYMRLVVGASFAFREAAVAQGIYLVLFSYAFFFKGFTGLAITIGAILTLFVVMQATGRIRWSERLTSPAAPPRVTPNALAFPPG
ncbi:MAG: hypothetical protein FJW30_25525 [Acidobacteria bacterium]|nr:hypothetical protein [Acidobacteriota bacterium]